MNEQSESLFIGDTSDGRVFVSRTPGTDLVEGPLQVLVISGKELVTPPKMILTRQEFRIWREEMQDEGYTIELRFAS